MLRKENAQKKFFEEIHTSKKHIGLSPSGKAPVFDTGIRWFESSQPSQYKTPAFAGVLYWLELSDENQLVR